jgi:hypothetical protein
VEITNELLEKIIAREAVGASKSTIKSMIKDFLYDLTQSKQVVVESEDGYGSGYASYVDVFCYKTVGRSSLKTPERTVIDGITIYLCKHAPVAVMGAMKKTRYSDGGSSGFLHAEDLNTFPPGNWLEVGIELRKKLEKHGFTILDPRELKKPMPFNAKIDTLLGKPPYEIFDAFFHWYD